MRRSGSHSPLPHFLFRKNIVLICFISFIILYFSLGLWLGNVEYGACGEDEKGLTWRWAGSMHTAFCITRPSIFLDRTPHAPSRKGGILKHGGRGVKHTMLSAPVYHWMAPSWNNFQGQASPMSWKRVMKTFQRSCDELAPPSSWSNIHWIRLNQSNLIQVGFLSTWVKLAVVASQTSEQFVSSHWPDLVALVTSDGIWGNLRSFRTLLIYMHCIYTYTTASICA